MNIEELEDNHYKISDEFDRCSQKHTKLSIQFAIEVLEELDKKNLEVLGNSLEYFAIHAGIEDKIQELKQYLDERNNN